MENRIQIISFFSVCVLFGAAIANVETPHPLGTSDLVRDKRLEEFIPKEVEIEPIRWTWNAENVELDYEEDNGKTEGNSRNDGWDI